MIHIMLIKYVIITFDAGPADIKNISSLFLASCDSLDNKETL